MNGNALYILDTTSKAIRDAELNENSAKDRDASPFVDIYPCACGHCTECGLNFVATPEGERRWAEEDANGPEWEEIDGEWFKIW